MSIGNLNSERTQNMESCYIYQTAMKCNVDFSFGSLNSINENLVKIWILALKSIDFMMIYSKSNMEGTLDSNEDWR